VRCAYRVSRARDILSNAISLDSGSASRLLCAIASKRAEAQTRTSRMTILNIC
jgi:hypothetical protein